MTQSFAVRWADLDPNGHLRHSVYADLCTQTRLDFLASLGFGLRDFQRLQLSPILFREDLRYHREVLASDQLTVAAEVSGLTTDGARWHLQHTIRRDHDSEVVATVHVEGAWFDLRTRRVLAPPPELADAMRGAVRHDTYQDLTRRAAGAGTG